MTQNDTGRLASPRSNRARPPVGYPEGWFQIAYAEDLAVGQALLEEFDDPEWVGYIRNRYVISSIVQEIVENVFDAAHGQFVHQNAQGTEPVDAIYTFDGHSAEASLEIDLPLVGGRTKHITTLFGPGIALNRSTGHGTKSFFSSYTPIDERTVEANFSFMTPRRTAEDPTSERPLASARATAMLKAAGVIN